MASSFFKDDRDRLHGGRIAGVIYLAILFIGTFVDYWGHDIQTRRWLPRALFTSGWWLAAYSKQPAQSMTELLRLPHVIGLILMAIGLILSLYWPFY